MDRRSLVRGSAPASALALLLVAAPARADHDRVTMPTVVVEAPALLPDRAAGDGGARRELERVPGGTALVPAQEIERGRASNLKDALDFVPGVLVRPRFGAADESQLSVRGSGLRSNFHLRGLNVLVDGFPYGSADGFSDFESLELLATKRLELYKGANALRFGAGSLGGALNLVTKTGGDAAPLELSSEGGSFGYQKHYLGTGAVSGPWDAYAAFSDTELEGFRDHAEQVRRRAFGTLGWTAAGGTTLRLDLGYARNEEELPGALTAEELDGGRRRADPESVSADAGRFYDYGRGALSAWMPIDAEQSVEAAVQANVQDLFHPLAFAVLTGDTWSWSTETRWRRLGPLLGRDGRSTVGVQYAGTRQEDVRFEPLGGARKGARSRDQRNEAWNVAVYGEHELAWSESLALVAGGRFAHADRSVDDRRPAPEARDDSAEFRAFSPKLGFVWRALPAAQVYGNVSHAYEPPVLIELTAPQDLAGRLDDLDAQQAWQLEIGTRGRHGDRLLWDVSVYDWELRDELLNVNVVPFPDAPFTIPRYRNVSRSRHTGVEAGGELELLPGAAGEGPRGDSLRLRLAYTWSRFVFAGDDPFAGNRLPGAPEHALRSELRWESAAGLWLAPGVDAVPAAYPVDSANAHENGAYALLGARGGWSHAKWHLDLWVEGRNLLDETYASSVQVDAGNLRFFEPGDGRGFYGGVRWRWW